MGCWMKAWELSKISEIEDILAALEKKLKNENRSIAKRRQVSSSVEKLNICLPLVIQSR
jgi:hypothetical protein